MIKSLLLLLVTSIALADTPPPGMVKAKTWTGDGNTSISAHGTSLDVNVTNTTGLTTVNQGTGGVSAWKVDGSAVTQPVSGTFWPATQPVSGTFWQSIQPISGTLTCNAGSGTQAVSLATLPALTAGAATIGNVNINGTVPISGTITATNPANADTGSIVPDQATQVAGVDGSGDLRALKVTTLGVLSVDASGSTVPVSGTFWQATQPVSGTFWQATQPVSAASLPLPSGAATSALQTTANTSLSSIDTKTPALGQALAAGSVPVVLTASQLSTLTPLSSVSVSNFPATQPVSGTVTANAGTGTFTVDGSGHTQPVSGTFWQATQPVSIATAPALVASSAIIGKVGIDQTTPGTTNGVQVNAALPAGSNVIGHVIADSGSTTVVTGTVAATQSGNWNIQYEPINSTGSHTTGNVSTVITLTAPANAIGFILEAKDANTANLRWAVGATATTTSGMQLQPGRDTGYVPAGASVSVVSESGTQEYQVQWVSTH